MSFIDTEYLLARAVIKHVDYVHELMALVQEIPADPDVVKVTRCGKCLAWDKDVKRCIHSGRIQVGPESFCDRGLTEKELRY